RQAVAQIPRIVHLGFVCDRNTHHKGRKRHVLDALKLRRLHENARRPGTCDKALRLKAYSKASLRLSDDVVIAQITQMKLVHRGRIENLCISNGEDLCAPDEKGVMAMNARACNGTRFVIVEIVVVDEVIPTD